MDWVPGLQGSNINFDFIEKDLFEQNITFDFNFLQSPDSVYLLKGDSNVFNSIWCDNNSSINNGTIYISTGKDLTIIQINNGQAYIKDYYTKTLAGSSAETLKEETAVDITVNY